MRRRIAVALLCALASVDAFAAETLVVGSKRFTESYILGEIVARVAREHAPVQYRPGLGNTGIVFAALEAGSIDVYPDYTGTLAREVLKLEGDASLAELNRRLAPRGIGAAVPLGFDNSYALAMRDDRAEALGIRTVSDLARHPDLAFGFSQEFIARADGWPALQRAYGLRARRAAGTRPRPRLRGDGEGRHRRRGRLHDRRQDRALRAAHARGRPRRIPALRRDAGLPARRAAAISGGVVRDRTAGGAHRHARDDAHERGGRVGWQDLRGGRRQLLHGCFRTLGPRCAGWSGRSAVRRATSGVSRASI